MSNPEPAVETVVRRFLGVKAGEEIVVVFVRLTGNVLDRGRYVLAEQD